MDFSDYYVLPESPLPAAWCMSEDALRRSPAAQYWLLSLVCLPVACLDSRFVLCLATLREKDSLCALPRCIHSGANTDSGTASWREEAERHRLLPAFNLIAMASDLEAMDSDGLQPKSHGCHFCQVTTMSILPLPLQGTGYADIVSSFVGWSPSVLWIRCRIA